ncbi:MAG: histidinol-phosphatase [Spirochaetes bacterium]|nr:histidinol-phosphatase [Spirochaetota bacterium]
MIDFHNHTELCGHAEGTPEEYVMTAVKRGIRYFGFADHAPIEESIRAGITMSPDEIEDYISMTKSLKEKFAGKIEIFTGFEVDYPEFEAFDSSYYTDERIDYLIGSCHFIGDWPIDFSPEASDEEYSKRGVDSVCADYFNNVLSLAKSGKYNIIGHFDLYKKFGHRPEKDFSDIISLIAKEAAKNNTAIEINSSGLRKPVKEIYPSFDIIKLIKESGGIFTLGSDSHHPDDVAKDFDKSRELLLKAGVDKISYYRNRNRVEISL